MTEMIENDATNSEAMPAKAGRVPNGTRITQVWDFLNRERVGPELDFTVEHTAQLTKQANCLKSDVSRAFDVLEKKGLIKHLLLGRGKGYRITFVQKTKGQRINDQRKTSEKTKSRSIEDVRLAIKAEIAELEKTLQEKKVLLAQLDVYS
jgi:DNA-binding MarR family transcriptional regulator